MTSLPKPGEPQRDDTFRAVGAAQATTRVPCVIFPQVEQPQSESRA